MLQWGEPDNTVHFFSPKAHRQGEVCVLVGDRLRKRLREYPVPDLDAPLIPIKMRAV